MTGSDASREAVDETLIEAIGAKSLVSTIRRLRRELESVDSPARKRVDDAVSSLEILARGLIAEADELARALDRSGVEARLTGQLAEELDAATPMVQVSSIEFTVDPAQSWAAHERLRSLGFSPWISTTEAGWEVIRRTSGSAALVRPSPSGYTTQVELQWEPGPLSRLPAALRPNRRDFEQIDLPRRLWPLYFPIRAVRLVTDRLRRVHPTESLGPFLGTPTTLIGPLLDLADVGPDDTVLDLGCGDGRILIEAARRGSRGIGVELRPELIELARTAATDSGVADRVEFTCGDASATDASDATVVFLFLPAAVTAATVGRLLEDATPGTRIVAHEQDPLPAAVTGERHALITPGGVTVGHRWVVET